jgi:hypothetical protein
MPKKVYGQKNVVTTNLKDYTEEQAKEKGKIFHQAWKDFEKERKEKNRKKIQKVLDKRNKK